jgi:transposase-like protein
MAQGKPLDPEVKQEVIEKVRNGKATPKQLADKHGVALTTIYRTVRKARPAAKRSHHAPRQRAHGLPNLRALMADEVARLRGAFAEAEAELERAESALKLLGG